MDRFDLSPADSLVGRAARRDDAPTTGVGLAPVPSTTTFNWRSAGATKHCASIAGFSSGAKAADCSTSAGPSITVLPPRSTTRRGCVTDATSTTLPWPSISWFPCHTSPVLSATSLTTSRVTNSASSSCTLQWRNSYPTTNSLGHVPSCTTSPRLMITATAQTKSSNAVASRTDDFAAMMRNLDPTTTHGYNVDRMPGVTLTDINFAFMASGPAILMRRSSVYQP